MKGLLGVVLFWGTLVLGSQVKTPTHRNPAQAESPSSDAKKGPPPEQLKAAIQNRGRLPFLRVSWLDFGGEQIEQGLLCHCDLLRGGRTNA